MSRKNEIIAGVPKARGTSGGRNVIKHLMMCGYVLIVGVAIGGVWGSMSGQAAKTLNSEKSAIDSTLVKDIEVVPDHQLSKLVREEEIESIQEQVLSVPPLSRVREPKWQRFAVGSDVERNEPKIALVIDDMGIARQLSEKMVRLPGPLTLSYLPYAKALPAQTSEAWSRGHELMVHLPMEPKNTGADPGPSALLTHMQPEELRHYIEYNLSRFRGFVGINNHMGSLFTEKESLMRPVFEALAREGVFFLDSRTSGRSVGPKLAAEYAVPVIQRDVFLDNSRSPAAIRRQLEKLEALAIRRGEAIGIGHPYPETIAVVEDWLSKLETKGIKLVPLSRLIELRYGGGAIEVVQK
ncbi:MAG: hypothetical protein CMF31_10380 [Kordiimonas sp.]|nr:hypothetical protein [Kordiimonas sp.]